MIKISFSSFLSVHGLEKTDGDARSIALGVVGSDFAYRADRGWLIHVKLVNGFCRLLLFWRLSSILC